MVWWTDNHHKAWAQGSTRNGMLKVQTKTRRAPNCLSAQTGTLGQRCRIPGLEAESSTASGSPDGTEQELPASQRALYCVR